MKQTNKPRTINIVVFWHNLVYKVGGFLVVCVVFGFCLAGVFLVVYFVEG